MTYQEIQSATQADQQLQAVIKASQTGTWPAELQRFHHLRQELTITADNVLLRGNRIIILQALRPKTLKLAHQGHQGIVKTKQLLRSKVWWPGIDNDAEQLINSCLACQATGRLLDLLSRGKWTHKQMRQMKSSVSLQIKWSKNWVAIYVIFIDMFSLNPVLFSCLN